MDRLVAFVPSLDLDRACAFYRDTLGLSLRRQDGFAAVFDVGGTQLRVVAVRELHPAPYTVLGWEVEDMALEVSRLKARGVTFQRLEGFVQDELDVWTAPSGDRVAWFKDPDGNTLSLSQHL